MEISSERLLSFISNESLYNEVAKVIRISKAAIQDAERKLFSNVIDPFSAIFDCMCQGVCLEKWMEQEKSRQIQKTLQNALGEFHQGVLGAVDGWQDLGTGHVIDIASKNKKIIAEVKNKYNTTKGNHKVVIYDDLKAQLHNPYKGFTAYYVEIIPPKKGAYNKPFTPSDNKSKKRRPVNENIRVIDGKSFYAIATGDDDGLRKVYEVLPRVISDIIGGGEEKAIEEALFMELFDRAY